MDQTPAMKHAVRRKPSLFFTLTGWVLGVPVTFLIAFLALLAFIPSRNGAVVHFFSRVWGRTILFLTGIRVEMTGTQHLPESGVPVLIVANHQSMFDIFAFAGYLPIRFAWIAKKELFRFPLVGAAMKAAGYIAIDRMQRDNAHQALENAAQQLRSHAVVIFPEGTRTRTGRVGRFKLGAAYLVHSANTPLIPVTITGSYQCLPKHSVWVSPGTIRIRIDPPIPTAGKTRETIIAELNEIRERIKTRVESRGDRPGSD
ncbi:MAG TPA: lysophospholipid acyltransferase family protein [bacterium]|nr:lysophospholipid acyltransferase family protein [bacterium]